MGVQNYMGPWVYNIVAAEAVDNATMLQCYNVTMISACGPQPEICLHTEDQAQLAKTFFLGLPRAGTGNPGILCTWAYEPGLM